ncbi:MAG: copper chaperone PCu(A)C [Ignavibacteriales bacterium]|nr:MAG: copper chaperone PCu(A)C [Ignavibacteriales bacterium]
MKRRLLIMVALIFMLNTIIFAQQPKTQNSKLKIQNAWVRPAAKGANSALYFVIENNSIKTDTLIGAESKIAEEVEVHESFKKDNDRMGMRPAGKLAINPKSEFEFKPGGFHIMLLGVTKDLKIGDKIEVVLLFKNKGKIKIKAEVSDMPITKKMKQ